MLVNLVSVAWQQVKFVKSTKKWSLRQRSRSDLYSKKKPVKLVDFICMVIAELWGTGSKRKIQIENIRIHHQTSNPSLSNQALYTAQSMLIVDGLHFKLLHLDMQVAEENLIAVGHIGQSQLGFLAYPAKHRQGPPILGSISKDQTLSCGLVLSLLWKEDFLDLKPCLRVKGLVMVISMASWRWHIFEIMKP